MPEWKHRTVKVELEFQADGSESDGTAVDLITEAVSALREMKFPRSGKSRDGRPYEGEVGMHVKSPDIRSITVVHR